MPHNRRYISALGAMLALLMLAGCPNPPRLVVQPLALSLGENQNRATIRILNQGGGTLAWRAEEDIPWLSLTHKSGGKQVSVIEGQTGTEVEMVELNVDRSLLTPGNTNGQIRITSNGGNQTVSVGVMQSLGSQIGVSSESIDFGDTLTEATFSVVNLGQGALTWRIEKANAAEAPWVSVSPTEGTLTNTGQSTAIRVTVDRGNLFAGAYTAQINVLSNGGDASVMVTMSIPPFSVSPSELAFGSLSAPAIRSIEVRNRGVDPLEMSILAIAPGGTPWLSVNPTTATLPVDTPLVLQVTASPEGAPPMAYSGEILIQSVAPGYEQSVPVSMTVQGIAVEPVLIDFGLLHAPASETLLLRNLGAQAVNWQITAPASTSAWMSVSPESGVLQSTPVNIQVSVNPLAVAPGAYEAPLTITSDAGNETVVVRMLRPKPAALKVEPRNIDFGASRVEELIGIWNDGIGTVDWRLDTSGFPEWLSVVGAAPGAILSGSVAGDHTDSLKLRVNRTVTPPGLVNFVHQFSIDASGDASTPVQMQVRMTVPLVPEVAILAEGTTSLGVDFINFDIRENTVSFFIRNEGTGNLNWAIDTSGIPAWFSSITPAQGLIAPGTEQRVTVSVDRSTLSYLGAQHLLSINSNDPLRPSVPLLVEVQVPKKVAVGARPQNMAFGINETSALLEVANTGDPETVLNFQITSSKDWLAVYPETGSSIGTLSPLKDWKPFSVSVDRSQLDGSSASGKLIVTAFTTRDGQRVPLEGVDPIEVNVSVTAAELTIEAARPRSSIPSQVRYVLMMRNLQYQALPIPDSRLTEVGNLFNIFENDIALERTETNQFMTSATRASANAIILLDYSGSMYAAAQEVSDPLVSGAPDPLQALYETTVSQLIQELPAHYRTAIAVFNERQIDPISNIRIIGSPAYTTDKAELQARLRSIVVVDHGATALLDAVADAGMSLLSAGDADIYALICVTDGGITTPHVFPPDFAESTRDINLVIRTLTETRVRPFFIGWGSKVYSEPLIRMSSPTGGHFYPTKNAPTGEFDAFGAPIRIPVVSELRNWCETDPLDPCDQSLPKDLKSQVAFSYIALAQNASVTTEGRITFDDPNDQDSPCLPEQGDITGSFIHGQLDYEIIAGDPRIGQIVFESEGIQPDGSAIVWVRAEFIPRNITQLSFQIAWDSPEAVTLASLTRASQPDGGIISNWTQTGAPPVYTFTSPGGPLMYGEFGRLLRLRFENATQPFYLRFTVHEPVYNPSDPATKRFMYANRFEVSEAVTQSTPFPSPKLETEPPGLSTVVEPLQVLSVDLGTTYNQAEVFVYNLGGYDVRPGFEAFPSPLRDIYLRWQATPGDDSRFLQVDPLEGFTLLSDTPDRFVVTIDRTLPPGEYTGYVIVVYSAGLVRLPDLERRLDWLQIRYTIGNPVLTLSTDTLDFGTAFTDLPLDITNTGQSVLSWSLPLETFPIWLTATRSGGALNPGESQRILLRVFRSPAYAGVYTFPFFVQSDDGQSQMVTVNAIIE